MGGAAAAVGLDAVGGVAAGDGVALAGRSSMISSAGCRAAAGRRARLRYLVLSLAWTMVLQFGHCTRTSRPGLSSLIRLRHFGQMYRIMASSDPCGGQHRRRTFYRAAAAAPSTNRAPRGADARAASLPPANYVPRAAADGRIPPGRSHKSLGARALRATPESRGARPRAGQLRARRCPKATPRRPSWRRSGATGA